MQSPLDALLDRFASTCDPGPFAYPWAHHVRGETHDHHVLVTMMVHGNEPGPLPAALRLMDDLASGAVRFGGALTLAVANPEAAREGRRFLDFDLNRAFAFVEGREGHEHTRARELTPLLDAADLLLDLHQTSLASRHPFWTFAWDPVIGRWARALQPTPVGITRPSDQGFVAPDLKCIDEYLRDQGKPGMTLELGKGGLCDEQAENAYRTMLRMLTLVDAIQAGTTTLADAAEASPPLTWYTTVHREAWGPEERHLRPGLANWAAVSAQEDLSAPTSPSITVPQDGVLLFPKYPPVGAPRPHHLFHLAVPLDEHPDVAFAPGSE